MCDSGYTGALTECISDSCPAYYSPSSWGMCKLTDGLITTGTCKESKYGQKFGGLCYDNDVDTKALIKVPFYGCPAGQTKRGAFCYTDSDTFRKEGIVYRSKTCAYDYKGIGGYCWSKVLGWVSGGCSNGYTLKAGMCYAKSKSMNCDEGSKNMGLNCQVDFKPSYHL